MEERKIYLTLENEERVSTKNGKPYNVVLITLVCGKCNASVVIENFGIKAPLELIGVPCTIIKNESNRYIISDLDFYVPYQYNMALNLLLNHKC